MTTLLVISQRAELAEALRDGLNVAEYRVIHRDDIQDAESALDEFAINACIFDLAGIEQLESVEIARQRLPRRPLIVCTDLAQGDLEEGAYLRGADHVLGKPLRPQTLSALLTRVGQEPRVAHKPAPRLVPRRERPKEAEPDPRNPWTLEMLRQFSRLLADPLSIHGRFQQLLSIVSERFGVNRAVVFLRHELAPNAQPLRLRAVAAIGLSAGLPEHFELSAETGIGGYLFREGRILWAKNEGTNLELAHEFEAMGTEVAMPIVDQNGFLGVAAFGGRVTGQELADVELELIYHLLGQIGLAVRSIWRHDRLASDHAMLNDIVRRLNTAYVVISRDLVVLHSNKAAQDLVGESKRPAGKLEFHDLPGTLRSRASQVLQTGTAAAPFKFQPARAARGEYQVTMLPIQTTGAPRPRAVLVVGEVLANRQASDRLDDRVAERRAVRELAAEMAHEIGNALVPISTYHQLGEEQLSDPIFRASFYGVIGESVKRLADLTNRMRSLARESTNGDGAPPPG